MTHAPYIKDSQVIRGIYQNIQVASVKIGSVQNRTKDPGVGTMVSFNNVDDLIPVYLQCYRGLHADEAPVIKC
jgi:hypothetical protein